MHPKSRPVNRNLECWARDSRSWESIASIGENNPSLKIPSSQLSRPYRKIQQFLSFHLAQIHLENTKTTYQVKALFRSQEIPYVGSLLRLWKNEWIRFHPPLFRPRYEVGWIPGGRLPSVSVELNAVLFFSGCVRSSGTYMTSCIIDRLESNGMEKRRSTIEENHARN